MQSAWELVEVFSSALILHIRMFQVGIVIMAKGIAGGVRGRDDFPCELMLLRPPVWWALS